MLVLIMMITALILLSFLSKSTGKTKKHSKHIYPPFHGNHDSANFSSMDARDDCGPSISGSDGGCGGGD